MRQKFDIFVTQVKTRGQFIYPKTMEVSYNVIYCLYYIGCLTYIYCEKVLE